MLAAMAQLTTRTRIGCAVVGNTYRHPAVLAKMAVTVDHLSGGRLEFGIGAGWAQNEHTMLGLEFGTRNDRADRLEESVQIIRSLWTQPRTTFEGRHYRLQDAVAEPKPIQQPYPPIWIGGSGPKRTLRITARYADVWNAAGGSPQEVAESSAILDRHCADVGRDPSQIRRSVQFRVGDQDAGSGREPQPRVTSRSASPTSCSSCTAPTRWPSGSGSRPNSRGCATSADGRRGSMTGQSALTVSAAPSTLSGRPVTLPVNLRCRTGG